MKFASKVIALSALLFIFGCGKNNPYIGTWESDPIMGTLTEKMEIKSSSVAGNGKEVSVSYKFEDKKFGISIQKDGNEVTQWFDVIDQNTLEGGNSMLRIKYHRK